MLFSSMEFLFIFFPLVYIAFILLEKNFLLRNKKILVILVSLTFYTYWKLDNLPLFLLSILFNYAVGYLLNEYKKKVILVFGVIINLAFLSYYKYYNLYIDFLNAVFGSEFQYLNIALPLAISFFTFQQLSYLVDIYRTKKKVYTSFVDYLVFISFFPQLIAGPIVRFKQIVPQFKDFCFKIDSFSRGVFLFSIGLAKKTFIADNLAPFVDSGFANPEALYLIESWVCSIAFVMQIYFDFSGYTDMALGLALMFNIKLPENFDSPFQARTIQDLWSRWNITLSRFLRDYVSLPLKQNGVNVYANILMTMLLSGIWHGAGFTFIVWGLMQGAAINIYYFWSKFNITLYSPIAWFLTFMFFAISAVFFKAPSMEHGLDMWKAMLSGQIALPVSLVNYFQNFNISFIEVGAWDRNIGGDIYPLLLTLICMLLIFMKNSKQLVIEFKPNLKYALLSSLLFVLGVIEIYKNEAFIYFEF